MLGIDSGLLFGLMGHTFTVYLNDMNIQIITIGFLSLRALPYHGKPLWAPIVDHISLPFSSRNFGQRKAWIITMQCILILCLIALGYFKISEHFFLVSVIAVITVFFAATKDIAMDGYRIELFMKNKLTQGTAFVVFGFRVGLVLSGTVGLYCSSLIGWQWTFIAMAGLIIPCMLVVALAKDNKKTSSSQKTISFTRWFKSSYYDSLIMLYKMPNFFIIFLLIAFYKVSDSYVDAMFMPFLLELGFSKNQIAEYAISVMIIASLLGTYVGTYLIDKYGLIRNLLCAELLAAFTNLTFIALVENGVTTLLLTAVAFIESFCSGICNIILITYLSSLCHRKFTATHYAVLLSISGITRTIIASTSGVVALEAGWVNFFIISALLSIPSLFCIYFLNRVSKRLVVVQ
ncbi:MAG: MFS transporter [Rickettsiales bacterium]